MLDNLAERADLSPLLADAAWLVEWAVAHGFAANRLRPVEFGGDQGTLATTKELLELIGDL